MDRFHRFDVLAAWYDEYLTINNYRPRSIRNSRYELSFFRRFLLEHTGMADIDTMEPRVLQEYASHLFNGGRKIRSIYTKMSLLKAFFLALYQENKLYVNYGSHIQLPHVHAALPSDILSEEEIKTVFAALEKKTDRLNVTTIEAARLVRDRAIFEMFYSTAIRRSELTALSLADIIYEDSVVLIRQGKGGKDRVVPIGTVALEALRRYVYEARPRLAVKGNDILFVNQRGTKLNDNGIRASVMHVTRLAGIERHVRVHALRHTCATHLINNGADIRYVQELLGHQSISSTQVYTHVSITKLKETHARCHPREQWTL